MHFSQQFCLRSKNDIKNVITFKRNPLQTKATKKKTIQTGMPFAVRNREYEIQLLVRKHHYNSIQFIMQFRTSESIYIRLALIVQQQQQQKNDTIHVEYESFSHSGNLVYFVENNIHFSSQFIQIDIFVLLVGFFV